MTREAKIGMLTGLGVIVLIGVLLSKYLGEGKDLGVGPGIATNRMQSLPIGPNYRRNVMEPAGAPNVMRSEAAVASMNPLPTAYAADTSATGAPAGNPPAPSGPLVTPPVAAMVMGPAPSPEMTNTKDSPPVIMVADPAHDAAAAGAAETADKPLAAKPVGGKTYVIVPNDNLAKIAKKFYGTSKESDVKRIVAANSTVLKDANTNLIVGKKLLIPDLQPTSKSVVNPVKAAATKTEPVIIYLPGGPAAKSDAGKPASVSATKKETAKTYEVKPGDTLEKIATRYAPSRQTEYVAKLKSLNGVKDSSVLKVGQTLKIPA